MNKSSSAYLRWGVILGVLGLLLSVWIVLARPAPVVRFATFNASLSRGEAGQLIRDLAGDDQQARAVAEIIQRVAPDVLLLTGFDYDSNGEALDLFAERYLGVGQSDAAPIRYEYRFAEPVNHADGGFAGQDSMVLLSRFPVLARQARTFQTFPWKSMPAPLQPEAAPAALSSKSHWDIPVLLSDTLEAHVLACYPGPPTGEGERNHDEIRFWSDYVDPARSDYARDDAGRSGGLAAGAAFVIMGDLGADPVDGASRPGAVTQLLDHPRVRSAPAPSSEGALQQYRKQWGANSDHRGDAALDTVDLDDETGPGNLRFDYVLPSVELRIEGAGVFWPAEDHPWFAPVGVAPFPASAHRLVWVDVRVD